MIPPLNAKEWETLIALADYGMNISEVAKKTYCSRQNVYYRLRQIENKTGICPLDFWGLKRLLESYGKERTTEDG